MIGEIDEVAGGYRGEMKVVAQGDGLAFGFGEAVRTAERKEEN